MANPLIRRYRYSLLRPHQVWIFGILYVSIIALVLFINVAIFQKQRLFVQTELWEMFQNLYIQFLIFQAVLLWILAPYNVSTVIPGEILEKSHDFSRMLPLSAQKKAVGILIGKNLIVLLLAVINCIFLLVFGFLGNVSWEMQAQIILLLISISAFICMVALLSSMNPFQKKGNSFLIVLIIIFFLGFGPLIGGMFELFENDNFDRLKTFFYMWEIPTLLLISSITLYFTLWTFIGILRRFTKEYDSLFTQSGALLFLLLYLILLLGLFYLHLFKKETVNSYFLTKEQVSVSQGFFIGFWVIGLIPVGLLPLGAQRSYEKYLELSRLCPPQKMSLGWLLRNSNLSLAAGLYLIWGLFCLGTGWLTDQDIPAFLITAGVLLTFFMTLIFMMETYITYKPVSSKLMYLMGFILILYFIFPFVLSGIFEREWLSIFSPAGYLVYSYDHFHDPITHLPPLAFNCMLGLIMAVLVLMRYYRIIELRSYMLTAPGDMKTG